MFDEDLAKFKTMRAEAIRWKGQDGVTVEGLLYYPVDYKAGTRYPLIVATHGGPAASDRFGFATEYQVYAAKGYAVLRPNYRGSTGYGDAFLRDSRNTMVHATSRLVGAIELEPVAGQRQRDRSGEVVRGCRVRVGPRGRRPISSREESGRRSGDSAQLHHCLTPRGS